MPLVTVQFNLPDEQPEYDMFNIASSMHSALFGIQSLLRSIEKGYEEDSEEMYNEKLFDKLRDIISESDIWKIP